MFGPILFPGLRFVVRLPTIKRDNAMMQNSDRGGVGALPQVNAHDPFVDRARRDLTPVRTGAGRYS
jgi:hypothetical protein